MERKMFLTFAMVLFFSIAATAQEEKNLKENSEVTEKKQVAQEEKEAVSIVTHKVEMGETVMLIAKKYHITPKDIYELNPEATKGISYNMMISLPADKIGKKWDGRVTSGHQVADTGADAGDE